MTRPTRVGGRPGPAVRLARSRQAYPAAPLHVLAAIAAIASGFGLVIADGDASREDFWVHGNHRAAAGAFWNLAQANGDERRRAHLRRRVTAFAAQGLANRHPDTFVFFDIGDMNLTGTWRTALEELPSEQTGRATCICEAKPSGC